MSKWIRKGDKAVVIAGNDKGKVSTVLSRNAERVILQGVNVRKKHLKSRQQGVSSQIIDKEMGVHISNVNLCDESGKPIKVKVRQNTSGDKELYYLKDGKEIFYRNTKLKP